MGIVMVRYKVKADQAARNEDLVRQVYDELKRTAAAGIRYATFVLEDGVSFIHVAANEVEDGRNRLMDVKAFRVFQEGVKDRCDEPPVASALREVGSYGFWAG